MAYVKGDKSVWQLVLTYVLVGGVVYAVIYYFFLMKRPLMQGKVVQNQEAQTLQGSPTVVMSDAVMFKTDMKIGSFLVDKNGMSLYQFDKDTVNTSNCYQTCATNWPPFLVDKKSQSNQANLGVITRTDGTTQYTWMGKPLYYYAKDTKVGDILGDGFGGVWHLVKQ